MKRRNLSGSTKSLRLIWGVAVVAVSKFSFRTQGDIGNSLKRNEERKRKREGERRRMASLSLLD